MFDVAIKINGKKHSKKNPTLNDYRMMVEFNNEFYGKSFLNDAAPMEAAINLIADYYGGEVSATDIGEQLDLVEIMTCYRQIESNITEVFTGAPLKEALAKIQAAINQQTP